MKPIEIYQGQDASVSVDTGLTDLSSATAIEVYIDAPDQIKLTLADGDITNVTSTGFTLAIAAADTETVPRGSYRYQCRATVGGLKKQGRFIPDRIKIRASVFTNTGSGNDYGG